MAREQETQTAVTRLLERARKGDAGDRERLIDAVYLRLDQLCRGLLSRFPGVGAHEQTGDVMGAVWPRLLAELEVRHFENSGHFFSFSATLIRNTLIDLLRKHYGRNGQRPLRARTLPGASGVPLEGIEDPGGPEGDLLQGEIHALIAQLPREQREMFDLRFYHGLRETECAEVLGLDRRTVRRRWRSARLTLADRMER